MQLTSLLLALTIPILHSLGSSIPRLDTLQTPQNGTHSRVEQIRSSLLKLPTSKNLKPEKLLKRMKNDLNLFWMSIERPPDFQETLVQQKLEIPSEEDFRLFNLTGLQSMLSVVVKNMSRAAGPFMVRDVMNTVRAWLAQQSTCPVYYQWEDFGPLYWPRWVRRGACSMKQSAAHKPSTCSWPPGMNCVPGPPKKLRILRWSCRYNTDVFGHMVSPRLPDRLPASGDIGEALGAIVGRNFSRDGFLPETSQRDDNVVNVAEFFRNYDRNRIAPQRRDGDGLTHLPTRSGHAEDDVNATEKWKKQVWRDRKRLQNAKCKWVKIPHPVTDDCFCSC